MDMFLFILVLILSVGGAVTGDTTVQTGDESDDTTCSETETIHTTVMTEEEMQKHLEEKLGELMQKYSDPEITIEAQFFPDGDTQPTKVMHYDITTADDVTSSVTSDEIATSTRSVTSVAPSTSVASPTFLDDSTTVANCDVNYNSKCFQALGSASLNIDYNMAKENCHDIGWKLANIYSKSHYDMLLSYLRSKNFAAGNWVSVWTGMTYENKTLFLRSGNKAPHLDGIWYPDAPNSAGSHTNIALYANKDPDNSNQGINNYTPSTERHGAICEF